MVKLVNNHLLQNQKANNLEPRYVTLGMFKYKDLRLSLTYFTPKHILIPSAFNGNNVEMLIFQLLLKPKLLCLLDLVQLMRQLHR